MIYGNCGLTGVFGAGIWARYEFSWLGVRRTDNSKNRSRSPSGMTTKYANLTDNRNSNRSGKSKDNCNYNGNCNKDVITRCNF